MNTLLIDGSGLAYRSYYAFIRNPLRNSAGEETSLTFGFLNTLLGVLQRYSPTHAAVVFDTPGRNFRHDIDTEYKAGRPPMPESMAQQFTRLRQALNLLRLPVLEVAGVEADDVLGTLASRFSRDGQPVWLLTADKDFFQILSEHIKLIRFKRVAGDLQEYGPAEFFADTELRPEQMVDFLALCGDSVDNVRGVAGIGEKTARQLIRDYGSLENLLEQVEAVDKPGLRRKLLAGREDARRSQDLVRIRTDVELEASPELLAWEGPDWPAMRSLLRELEFMQLLKTLPEALAETAVPRRAVALDTEARWLEACASLQQASVLALHVVTTQPEERRGDVRGVVLAAGDHSYFVPVMANRTTQQSVATLFDAPDQDIGIAPATFAANLQPLLDRPEVVLVGSDLKGDLRRLQDWGVEAGCRLFDTMVADWLLHPSRRTHDLTTTALEHLQQRLPGLIEHAGLKGRNGHDATTEQMTTWAGLVGQGLLQLHEQLPELLSREHLDELFTDVEMPLLRVLLQVEATGVKVDTHVLEQLSKELSRRATELATTIYEQAGHEFNIQSPKQLGAVLFEELGLPHGKRTRTGWSTDSNVLEKLAEDNDLPRRVLEYRQLSKLQSTYTDALPRLVRPETGRIHTSFNQAVASTGRLSSSEPNLQNIPIRTELGRRIRAAFVPESRDACLMSADYSQVELRIMAHLSQDRGLVQAFREGGDIHTLTAARIAGCEPHEVVPRQRATAKTVNFGVLYGMGARGLARQLGIKNETARTFIEDYFATYPGVRAYINECVDRARSLGYVTTILGRRLHLPDLTSAHPAQRAFAERVAVNAPIQGSAADLIKMAMVRVYDQLQRARLQARMILQVHDELLFECPLSEVDPLRALAIHEMENAMQLSVPLVVDVGRGANWDEAH